jgi:hypothetical protein
MDDRKVFELKRLELAYLKQLHFLGAFIVIAVMGGALYIINIYNYFFPLFIIAVVLILCGFIGMMTVDKHMKEISRRISEM